MWDRHRDVAQDDIQEAVSRWAEERSNPWWERGKPSITLNRSILVARMRDTRWGNGPATSFPGDRSETGSNQPRNEMRAQNSSTDYTTVPAGCQTGIIHGTPDLWRQVQRLGRDQCAADHARCSRQRQSVAVPTGTRPARTQQSRANASGDSLRSARRHACEPGRGCPECHRAGTPHYACKRLRSDTWHCAKPAVPGRGTTSSGPLSPPPRTDHRADLYAASVRSRAQAWSTNGGG